MTIIEKETMDALIRMSRTSDDVAAALAEIARGLVRFNEKMDEQNQILSEIAEKLNEK